MMVYGKENNTAILVKTFATLNHLHMICAFSNNPPPPLPWTVWWYRPKTTEKSFIVYEIQLFSVGEGEI